MPARLAAESTFPAWYSGVFADRWKFATVRLAVMATPVDRELIMTMGGSSPLDRCVLRLALALPIARIARLTTLAWLWFRLRPTTLIGLARTALALRLERFRGTPGEPRLAPPAPGGGRDHGGMQ